MFKMPFQHQTCTYPRKLPNIFLLWSFKYYINRTIDLLGSHLSKIGRRLHINGFILHARALKVHLDRFLDYFTTIAKATELASHFWDEHMLESEKTYWKQRARYIRNRILSHVPSIVSNLQPYRRNLSIVCDHWRFDNCK